VYMDFDRAALRDHMSGLSPSDFRTRLSFVPRTGGNTLDGSRWALASWYAGCDWAEGDGGAAITTWTMNGMWYSWYDNMYNWSAGTTAAGKWSPEMKWKDDGAGGREPDLDNMTGWKYPDGTELPFRPEDWSYDEHHKGIEELWFHGHDRFNAAAADVYPTEPGAAGPWTRYDMAVDDAVMQDLLDDVSVAGCRGLRMWAGFDSAEPRNHDTSGMSTRWMFTREAGAVTDIYGGTTATAYDYRPYLEIVCRGDANIDAEVDVFDLAALANNYGGSGKAWEDGDFSEDGDVNVFDLSLLANHYGWSTGGGEAEAIPEPVAATLLVVGTIVVARRRSGRGRPAA